MNNQVYKCERCGKLYAQSDLDKHGEKIQYLVTRSKNACYYCDEPAVGLCDECAIELTEWMERGQTRTAPTPEKKEEAPNYNKLIAEALAKQMIEYAMGMNEEEN